MSAGVLATRCRVVKERPPCQKRPRPMPRILLLHTGGTLGMVGHRPTALRPGAFFRTLKQRAPELFDLADIELELFSNVDSCEMQPEAWSALATHLFRRLPGFDGAVVTHGTDTLTFTASALSFMLPNLAKPVVLTGSQRPLGEIRSDARLNLIDAVTAALRGPSEVTICFDSHLYRGNRAVKVKVAEYDAFESPNLPPLGVLGVDARFEPGLLRRARPGLIAKLDPSVTVLFVHPGLDADLACSLLDRVHGVVLQAYGAGNFPVAPSGRSLRGFLVKARRRGVPVVVTSQALRNGVDLSLYESGAAARAEGALSGGDMTLSAALTKLMVALANHTAAKVAPYLERCVAGERSE